MKYIIDGGCLFDDSYVIQWVNNLLFKISESWYIALFVVTRSIKKLFLIDFVNIYLLSGLLKFERRVWRILKRILHTALQNAILHD